MLHLREIKPKEPQDLHEHAGVGESIQSSRNLQSHWGGGGGGEKKRERREEDMLEEVEQAIDGETAEEVDAVETQEGRV